MALEGDSICKKALKQGSEGAHTAFFVEREWEGIRCGGGKDAAVDVSRSH